MFGSGYAAAVYLSQVLKFPKDKKVFIVGESGMEEELESVGIQHVGGTVSHPPAWSSFLPGHHSCLVIIPAWSSFLPGHHSCLVITEPEDNG